MTSFCACQQNNAGQNAFYGYPPCSLLKKELKLKNVYYATAEKKLKKMSVCHSSLISDPKKQHNKIRMKSEIYIQCL